MPRSFRFAPPEPRPGSLTRPRLLRALLARWEHRVTTVVGGPGLGKTTLLAQAVAENHLAPRGEDVWIGLEPADVDGDVLARDVLAAVVAEPGDRRSGGEVASETAPGAPAVADAVWRRSPTSICLMFDDAHVLTPGSPGARWLVELVDALPANGHVVLAGRWSSAVPLARLATHGAVLRLTEDDLRFSDDELAGFAARRGIDDIERFGDTGGWPAMAGLAASVERDLAGDYLWEEVLEPLGPERRHALAVVSDLGGADDDLAAAAGLRAALTAPGEATEPLRAATELCRGVGDVDGELGALALWAGWPGGDRIWRCWPRCSPGCSSWRPRGTGSPGPSVRSGGRSSPTSAATTTPCSPTSGPSSPASSTTPGRRWPTGCGPPRWRAAVGPTRRSRSSTASRPRPIRRSGSPSRAAASPPAGRRGTSTRSWPRSPPSSIASERPACSTMSWSAWRRPRSCSPRWETSPAPGATSTRPGRPRARPARVTAPDPRSARRPCSQRWATNPPPPPSSTARSRAASSTPASTGAPGATGWR